MKLHDRDSVAAFAAEAWQHDAFSHFASTLTQRAPAFPCYFVVCATPSHHARKSRHSRYLMLTFQPRWVFEGLIGPDAPRTTEIQTEIRERIAAYDTTPASGFLSTYGLKRTASGNSTFWTMAVTALPGPAHSITTSTNSTPK